MKNNIIYIVFCIFISSCSIYKANKEQYYKIVMTGNELEKKLQNIETQHLLLVTDLNKRREIEIKWRDVYKDISTIRYSFREMIKPFIAYDILNTLFLQLFDDVKTFADDFKK